MDEHIMATEDTSTIIRNEEAPGSYSEKGPYSYNTYQLPTDITTGGATVYYPSDTRAHGPFSALVYCPPHAGTQIVLEAWGPFFASHGIVLITFDTRTIFDPVDLRAIEQRIILDKVKEENTRLGSFLYGELNTNRIGAMGWSMGGGASWINSAEYLGLKTAMSLAGHNLTSFDRNSKGFNTKCPTLIMNGAKDISYFGGWGQSSDVYNNIPEGIPKILYEVSSAGHFDWTTPDMVDPNVAVIALAFQKTYLDGDTRWAKYIARPINNVSTWETENIVVN